MCKHTVWWMHAHVGWSMHRMCGEWMHAHSVVNGCMHTVTVESMQNPKWSML